MGDGERSHRALRKQPCANEETRMTAQRPMDGPSIVFTDERGTDFDHHAFQFGVLINGQRRLCVIAQETVDDYFEVQSDARHDERWEVFVRNRERIEVAALEAIRNINVGPDGRIVVGMDELRATESR